MVILHSTIVNPDHTRDSVGIESYWQWVYPGTVVSNTAVFGFEHAAAHLRVAMGAPATSFWLADHNATDNSAKDSGSLTSGLGQGYTVEPLPGAIYGVAVADSFVAATRDWRLSNGSPLRAAGSAYGSFTVNCDTVTPKCSKLTTYNFDTRDIIGTLRPQADHYDIGAWQSTRASPTN
jgi:hypothetical protein